MSYVIHSASGQYWGGECWTVRQAAQDYDSLANLPPEIEGAELTVYATEGQLDARYEDEAGDCIASVRTLSGPVA